MSRYPLVRTVILVIACAAVCSSLTAQERAPINWLRASPQDMEWWRAARFGLFIHWGPVSLKGTEIGWSRGGERRGTGGTGEIPVAEYDSLYTRFNPVKFNAAEWVETARAAGMKYIVFTTKHHDGFCEFDSKLTDYTIMHSPFRRDVVRELVDACHKAKMPIGFYYSPPDWHSPDYRTENHARYIRYMHGHLRELCSNYGRIDIIWFDGLGGTARDWDAENLFKLIRGLQPHVIINNRAGLEGDFDTPEQKVGAYNTERAWESCITICEQWAWKPDDKLKSLEECIRTLVRTAGGDGNLLLNVGPMPDGRIEPRQVERLKEMGVWLKKYGATVYDTRGGPFRPGAWGASTVKGGTVWLHVLSWSGDMLNLPPLPVKFTGAKVLTGGTVDFAQDDRGIRISVPPAERNAIDTIIALTMMRE